MIILMQQCLLKRLNERKMKTMNYNLQKGIITSILVLIISTVGFAASKSHETSTATKSNMAEASTVNHEASSTGGASAEAVTESKVKELSYQIEDWMSNGSYWEADNSSEVSEKDLATEIESWMSNGSYWDLSHHSHKTGEKLAGKIQAKSQYISFSFN